MKYENLSSCEKEVFAGVISAGGAGAELLLEAMCDEVTFDPSKHDSGGINSLRPDNTVVIMNNA